MVGACVFSTGLLSHVYSLSIRYSLGSLGSEGDLANRGPVGSRRTARQDTVVYERFKSVLLGLNCACNIHLPKPAS